MTNLTAKELKIFNNLSRVQSPSVSLGNKNSGGYRRYSWHVRKS